MLIHLPTLCYGSRNKRCLLVVLGCLICETISIYTWFAVIDKHCQKVVWTCSLKLKIYFGLSRAPKLHPDSCLSWMHFRDATNQWGTHLTFEFVHLGEFDLLLKFITTFEKMVWTIMGSWNHQQKCWSGVGCLKRAKNKYLVSLFVMRSNTPYHLFLLNHDSHQKPRVGRRWIYSFVGHINQRVWHQGKYGSQPAKMDPIWWVHRCPCLTYQNQSSSLKVFFRSLWSYELLMAIDQMFRGVVTQVLLSFGDMLWYIVIYCDILHTTVHRYYVFLVAEICSSNPVFHSFFSRFLNFGDHLW